MCLGNEASSGMSLAGRLCMIRARNASPAHELRGISTIPRFTGRLPSPCTPPVVGSRAAVADSSSLTTLESAALLESQRAQSFRCHCLGPFPRPSILRRVLGSYRQWASPHCQVMYIGERLPGPGSGSSESLLPVALTNSSSDDNFSFHPSWLTSTTNTRR